MEVVDSWRDSGCPEPHTCAETHAPTQAGAEVAHMGMARLEDDEARALQLLASRRQQT